jgi:hypothetical protein
MSKNDFCYFQNLKWNNNFLKSQFELLKLYNNSLISIVPPIIYQDNFYLKFKNNKNLHTGFKIFNFSNRF